MLRDRLGVRRGPRMTRRCALSCGSSRRSGRGGGTGARITGRDKKALSALIWSHINPYGTFHIDMSTHLDLGPATGHAEAA